MGEQMRRLDAVRERLRPVIAEIAAGTVAREKDHELPFAQVTALRAAGFGRLRLPIEHGGFGLDWESFAEVLIELAAADSNLPQIFRGHIAYVCLLYTSDAADE